MSEPRRHNIGINLTPMVDAAYYDALKAENERLVAERDALQLVVKKDVWAACRTLADSHCRATSDANAALRTELAELRAKAMWLHQIVKDDAQDTETDLCRHCNVAWWSQDHAPDCPAHPAFLGAKGAKDA